MQFIPVGLRPYAKAVVPYALTFVAVLVEYLINGTDWNNVMFWTAVTGLGHALFVTVIANASTGWARAAKAILPAAGAVALIFVTAAQTHDIDRTQVSIAVTALIAAVVTYFVPNTALSHDTDGGSSPVVARPRGT